MDGTMLDGRFVHDLGIKIGVLDKIKDLQKDDGISGYQRTVMITRLFKGVPITKLYDIVRSMKMAKNLQYTINEIKRRGHIVGIISDSYLPMASDIADRFGLDFVIANDIEMDSEGVLTGEVRMPLGWEKIDCFCKISVCKRYHMENMSKKFGIPINNTIAIGDTLSDSCMIQRAGTGIAFNPKDKKLVSVSDAVILDDISKVLSYIV